MLTANSALDNWAGSGMQRREHDVRVPYNILTTETAKAFTDHSEGGNAVASVRLFPLCLWNRVTVDLELWHVSSS